MSPGCRCYRSRRACTLAMFKPPVATFSAPVLRSGKARSECSADNWILHDGEGGLSSPVLLLVQHGSACKCLQESRDCLPCAALLSVCHQCRGFLGLCTLLSPITADWVDISKANQISSSVSLSAYRNNILGGKKMMKIRDSVVWK